MAFGERTDVLSLSGMSSPVEIVDQVIGQAIRMKASDVLFEPQEAQVGVRMRVDGVLHMFGTMPHGSYGQVVSRLKILGNMDVTESRKPQESKIRFEVDGHPYVLRAAIVSTNFGEMCALRVLDLPQYTTFEQLGMSESLTVKVKQNIEGRYGLFLVCGPTGSGKTTTVHTCLKYLNNGEVNIMTLEDPVEYIIPGINQIEVGENIGMDFANGLREVLRLNPDVVFVGEIRDAETAKIAVQASLTGHLVISTIHSRNSVGALYRLIDLGVDKFLLNYAVRAILSQRLLRKNCDHCRGEYHPTPQEEEFYAKEHGGSKPVTLMAGVGCDLCSQTMFSGRVGVFEMLEMDEQVRKLVTEGVGETEFNAKMELQKRESMNTLGWKLVDQGVTSLQEYIRTVQDAK